MDYKKISELEEIKILSEEAVTVIVDGGETKKCKASLLKPEDETLLPTVTEENEGEILKVVNGVWQPEKLNAVDFGSEILSGNSGYFGSPWKIIKDCWNDIPFGMVCGMAV